MFKNSLRRRPSLALAGILIAIGGCAESPSTPAAPHFLARGAHVRFDASGTGAAVIDARGGTVQTSAGDRIVFPAGAVSQPTTVQLTSDATLIAVEVEPHGLTFPAGHEPTLILNGSGTRVVGAAVGYVDPDGNLAEVLRADNAGGADKLRTTLHHFSKYVALGG